jgi:hypothetical protein
MTTPETNGGWGELMPVWFKPYERPVPFYCLDNWALFALVYRWAFGLDVDASAFAVEHLVRVIVGADLLIPFLPGTGGAGRFLRHGALPVFLAILWLEPKVRAAWLALHERGADACAVEHRLGRVDALRAWLDKVEDEAWLVPERELVAGDVSVSAFIADPARLEPYRALFGGLCLSLTALASEFGTDWRSWVFQAVNVAYRTPDFGLEEIVSWIEQKRERTAPKPASAA